MKSEDPNLNGAVEIRHVKGRTVRVTRHHRLIPSEEEKKQNAEFVSSGAAMYFATEHNSTSWGIDILGLNGWIFLFKHKSEDRQADLFEMCFEMTAKVLSDSVRCLLR